MWTQLARDVVVRAVLLLGVGAAIGALFTPAASATLLVAVVVAIQPFYGRRRFQRFVRLVRRQPAARVRYYVSGIAGSWMYVGAVGVVGGLAGRHPGDIGLTLHAANRYETAESATAIISVVIGLTVTTAVIWVAGPKLVARVRRAILPLADLLPRTRAERVTFAGVALTAGICEEILYRGFGIAYLKWLDPSISRPAIVAVTATAFGLAHLYQGPRNVLLTGIVGAMLASLTLATGTLLPAIVIHVLIDLRVSFLPPKIIQRDDDHHGVPLSSRDRSNAYVAAD